MNTYEHTSLLEGHGIKPTANRLLIVKALASQHHPVSVKDLEDSLLTLDKSSIFRVLTLFREHHLVHAIDDEHVHFYCERCHRTICLHDIPVPQIPVPEGYRAEGINVLVRGICERCLKL